MSYLGRALTAGNYLKLDDLSSQFNGTQKTFNLTSGGQAFYPGSAFSILVSLGGVIQEPESAYQINQSQITFAVAPQVSDDFFCIALGVALGVGVPGEGTVSGSKLTKPFNYDDGLLYLDDTNNRVGINSTTPGYTFDVNGDARIAGILTVGTSSLTLNGQTNQINGVTISSGIITATTLVATTGTFTGNVSIGGTLTYEDVTNIDSVGVITARSGVRITDGGLVVTSGVSTVVGFATFQNNVSIAGSMDVNGNINFNGDLFQDNQPFVASRWTAATNGLDIYRLSNVGIGTTNPSEKLQVESGNIFVSDGALLTDQNINVNVSIGTGKNGLLIGPVSVGLGVTIDVAPGSTLVIV